MGKRKPRHDPMKIQNRIGTYCHYYYEDSKGVPHCERHWGDTSVCKGNRHNCIKVKYRYLAARSDRRKMLDTMIDKIKKI